MTDLSLSALKKNMQVTYWDPRIRQWSRTTVAALSPEQVPPYVEMHDDTILDFEAGGVGTGWSIYDENDPESFFWRSEMMASWYEDPRQAVEEELGGGDSVVAWAERLLLWES